MAAGDSVRAFYAARDFLLAHRDDYDTAYRELPLAASSTSSTGRSTGSTLLAARAARDRPALWIVEEDGTRGHADLRRAVRPARTRWPTGCARRACARGDRILLMLGNQVELWETMLAAMKLGAVIIPATTLLGAGRPASTGSTAARSAHVVAARRPTRRSSRTCPATTRGSRSAAPVDGLAATTPTPTRRRADFTPGRRRRGADDPLLLYFTSGTTAQPKLVEHTHASYPVGHLSTMYWIGLQPGDVHLNISSPGWAKHAWSNVFAPWNAEATRARRTTTPLRRRRAARRDGPVRRDHVLRAADGVADADPGRPARRWQPPLREVVGAGEPLNPEVIEQVAAGLGPDDPRRLRPDRDHRADRQHAGPAGQARLDGPAAARLRRRAARPGHRRARPTRARSASTSSRPAARADGRLPRRRRAHRRGDARRLLPHRRRRDRATPTATSPTSAAPTTCSRPRDYRISPFELESVLIEHPAVAEAAVVPSPDPLRLAVPKAYVVLAAGYEPDAETAARDPRATPASTSRRTSASAGWSSPSCPRRSPARSAGSSCGAGRRRVPPVRHPWRSSHCRCACPHAG